MKKASTELKSGGTQEYTQQEKKKFANYYVRKNKNSLKTLINCLKYS